MPIKLLLSLSILLLIIGLTLVLTKKQPIFTLMGIELITNGAHLNIMVFSSIASLPLSGYILVLFSMIILVCELAIALAIILQLYRSYRITTFPQLNKHTSKLNIKL